MLRTFLADDGISKYDLAITSSMTE